MSRSAPVSRSGLLLAVSATACLALAATPAAFSQRWFTLTVRGGKPMVAVDRAGTGHFVWDERAPDGSSITHYCRVPRRGRGCLPGSERVFVPPAARNPSLNTDFADPQVFWTPPSRVIVVTHRCCGIEAPNFGSAATFRYVSVDGGETFDAGAMIGSVSFDGQRGLVLGPGEALSALGTGAGGSDFQLAPLDGPFATGAATLAPGVLGVYKSVGFADAPANSVPLVVISNGGATNLVGRFTGGDPNDAAAWTLARMPAGRDLKLVSGRSGTWLFALSRRRYVLRRYLPSRHAFGRERRLSGRFPIFGTATQDAAGRVHAVWREGGLRYRRTDASARRLTRTRRLGAGTAAFNLVVGASAGGRGWVAWDSNANDRPVRAVAIP